MSFIEILVAVVLLGTVVLGVLGALLISITGSRIERDHARALQWLQSSIGVVQATPRVSCDSGEEAVRLAYQTAIRSTVLNPPGWEDRQIEVLRPVKVWNGNDYLDPYTAPQSCYDVDGFRLQLIRIQVTNPDGDIIETIEVVKDG